VPRPKSELTKNGKAIGIRLTQSQYEQWKHLGATKWLRKQLTDSPEDKKRNEQTAKTLSE